MKFVEAYKDSHSASEMSERLACHSQAGCEVSQKVVQVYRFPVEGTCDGESHDCI